MRSKLLNLLRCHGIVLDTEQQLISDILRLTGLCAHSFYRGEPVKLKGHTYIVVQDLDDKVVLYRPDTGNKTEVDKNEFINQK